MVSNAIFSYATYGRYLLGSYLGIVTYYFENSFRSIGSCSRSISSRFRSDIFAVSQFKICLNPIRVILFLNYRCTPTIVFPTFRYYICTSATFLANTQENKHL